MSGSQGFTNVSPDEYFMYSPVSTIMAIKNKVNVEYLPDALTDYNYDGGQNEIRFSIQSNSEVLIGADSYLKFDLAITPPLGMQASVAGAATYGTNWTKNLTFESGGAHSLFSRIEVRANINSTTIQLQESYAKYYVGMSRNNRSDSLGAPPRRLDGDGEIGGIEEHGAPVITEQLGNYIMGGKPWSLLIPDNITGLEATITTAAEQAAATCTTKIMMYPLMSFLESNIPLFLMQNGIQIIFTLAPGIQALHVRTAVPPIFNRSFSLQGAQLSQTNGAVGANGVTVPASVYPVGISSIGVVIKNPRFVARLSEPTSEYAAQWVQRYRSPEGVIMSIPSCRRLISNFQVGSTSCHIIMLAGVRSLRSVFGGWFSSLYSEPTSSGTTQTAFIALHSSKHFPIRWPTKEHYFRVGSRDYPQRPIDLRTANSNTVLTGYTFTEGANLYCITPLIESLIEVFKNRNSMAIQYYMQPRYLKYYVWNGTALEVGVRLNTIGYIAQDFSKDLGPNGELTGVDCSVTPLEFHCEFHKSWAQDVYDAPSPEYLNISPYVTADYGGTPNLYMFCCHDAWVKIGADGIQVMQ